MALKNNMKIHEKLIEIQKRIELRSADYRSEYLNKINLSYELTKK